VPQNGHASHVRRAHHYQPDPNIIGRLSDDTAARTDVDPETLDTW